MLGTSGTISWNRPGEVISPRVIATAKSARPKMFQIDRCPSALSRAGRHGDRRRHGEQAGQHIANSRRQREHAGQRPAQPGSESPAAEYAVKLKSDEPGRRHRVEHLPHPLRQQQQRRADDHRQEDRQRQHTVRVRRP